jgi:polysaccharide deacetylase 2 family uncharacterized protein YibQ
MPNNSLLRERRNFLKKSAVSLVLGFPGMAIFSSAFGMTRPDKQPRLALIIDDIGFSHSRMKKFLEIGKPLTFSILPMLDYSLVCAEDIHDSGHEIMLHQPMEPFDPSVDPGPGATYVGDSPEKITNIIGHNIEKTPYVTGINNHMGSRFTSCGKEMEEALKTIKKQGLFFVDSLTTSESKGYKTARRMNICAARRNIFIDNIQAVPCILKQLERLKCIALRSGYAIGIGHPFPETAIALNIFFKEIDKSHVEPVYVSKIING